MLIYCAGPEVFLQNAHEVFAEKLNVCQKYGAMGITPFDADHPHERGSANLAISICRENMRLIDRCDAVVANITPWRGVHMDPGTSFEIGYALAKGKKVACYTQDERTLAERFEMSYLQGEALLDQNGYVIEDFGWSDNLMVEGALLDLGYPMVVHSLPAARRFVSILGFEDAVKQLMDDAILNSLTSLGL